MYALLSLHRRIALGARISHDLMGNWVYQYGQHLMKCGRPFNPTLHTFEFNPNQVYGGIKFNYQVLTGWILNSGFGNGTLQAGMVRWDNAIKAMIKYNINKNNDTWNDFCRVLDIARMPSW